MGQLRQDINIAPLILGGAARKKGDRTIAQNASRSTVLYRYTVMAKIAASGKWTPFAAVSGTDGSGVPRGIYVGNDITAAALVAGDIANCDIITGGDGALIDKNLLVWESSMTADTVFASGTLYAKTAEDMLAELGLFLQDSVDINNYEN